MAATLARSPRRRMRFWLMAGIGLATIGVLVLGVFYLFALEPLRVNLSQQNAPSCGSLQRGDPSFPYNSTATQITQDGTCLQKALTACRATTLKAFFSGVDAGVHYTFVVEPPMGLIHTCALAVVWQSYVVCSESSCRRSGTERCSGITVLARSFEVHGCGGEGPIMVP